MKITLQSFEYDPTPEQLAEDFCNFYEVGQARFFNKVAEILSDNITMQLEYITQSKDLTKDGRILMHKIGEYAHHNE